LLINNKNKYFLFPSVFSDLNNVLLPIKPKPFLYPKDSAFMSDCYPNLKTDQMVGDIMVKFLILFISYIV